MYAVFQSGGKQHRVAEGQTVRLEKIEVALGESIEFAEILMVSNGEDVKIGKFRRRKHSRTQMGHRQWFTEVKITGISA